VTYVSPRPELLGQAAAGKRYHQVPTLYRAQEKDSAAIRLISSVVVQLVEECTTASNWRQQLAPGSGWVANLVLKLKMKIVY
jgi:hypothetical protein